MRVCIVGASGKLGQYMVQQSLDRGDEVVGVCREQSVGKLDAFKGRITVIPGATDDREVIKRAVAGCGGVLVVMTPRGVHGYSTGTTQAVLDYAPQGARLIFSCGWHITLDGQDVYSLKLKALVKVLVCLRVSLASPIPTTRWRRPGGSSPATRGGPSYAAATLRRARVKGLPCGAGTWVIPFYESNITRRVDFRLFHGRGSKQRRTGSQGPRDCGPPDAFGARVRRLANYSP